MTAQKPSHAASDTRLPFDQTLREGGISPSATLVPSTEVVPAGTPLTIRLKTSISSATANPGELFSAILDQPIVVRGKNAVPQGTPVSGTVVAVNRYALPHAPAYLRLKLTKIIPEGKPIPVESSSVFTKAGVRKTDEAVGAESAASSANTNRGIAHFSADHPLTFRLTAAVDLPR